MAKQAAQTPARSSLKARHNTHSNARFWTAAALILVAAVLRILPHLPNFSPVTAMAVFAGAYFTRTLWAVALPLAAMILSDAVIGFHSQIPAVYLSFVLVTLIGMNLRQNRSGFRVAGASVAGSLLFFAITNFSVWTEGVLYPRTFNGLGACYVAALPFLQNSLVGDLCYTAVIFGAWALLERTVPRLRAA